MLDVAILVPFQGHEGLWIEPVLRKNQGPARLLAILGRQRLGHALGCDLKTSVPRWARAHRYRVSRSAGAVALASSAERAGLLWHAIDPGEIEIGDWRRRLHALRSESPRLIAINTTFINEARWLHLFCSMVKRALPDSLIALGGYYYATDARGFLGATADVFCVGEGEVRLGQIAERVRDGRPLDDIPGLYIRERDGRLRSTGPPPALELESTPLPDWSVSARMDPALDPEREPTLFHVETQRGCVFKCDFCTFRTLAESTVMSPSRAAEAILGAARAGRGRTFLADATATFPKERWRSVLDAVEAKGGSPHPLTAFARVSDLDDEVCARMARVGVRHVFIGQESGDQAVLNAMRKGTRVSQVRPALDSLARFGVKATFGFISGFPGEDSDASRRSRDLMLNLNEGHAEPTALVVYMDVFAAQDLATAGRRAELGSRQHPLDYRDVPMSARAASEEALRHCLALAERVDAPVTGFGLTPLVGDLITAFSEGGDWQTGFRWLKAYDRGVGLFVRQELDGTPVDPRALHEVERTLVSDLDPLQPIRVRGALRERARTLGVRALLGEWRREPGGRPGFLTRLLNVRTVWDATRDSRASFVALRSAAPPATAVTFSETVRATRDVEADSLVELSLSRGSRSRVRRAVPTSV